MEDYCNNEKIIINEIISINKTLEYKSAKQKSKFDKKIFSKYKVLSKLEHIIVNEFTNKIYIGKVKDNKTRILKLFRILNKTLNLPIFKIGIVIYKINSVM